MARLQSHLKQVHDRMKKQVLRLDGYRLSLGNHGYSFTDQFINERDESKDENDNHDY